MRTKEALEKLKAILGKGLYPNAIPKAEEILRNLSKTALSRQRRQ